MIKLQAPTAIDQHTFRKTCGRFATGVAVATVAADDGTPCGLTINSFTSVSCAPPLVLICVDYRCSILPHFRASQYYGVNILTDKQRDLSVRFSQRQPDRFDSIDWYKGERGVPLIRGCLASFECVINQTVEAGDHAIFIAEVASAEWRDGEPLVYFGSSYRHLAERSS